MLHVWLIPALVVLLVAVAILYVVLRVFGGDGVRTNGRTVLDLPEEEDEQRRDE
jgi:hypothetical protein